MDIPDYSKLRSLGYRLFAPLITPALKWIVERAEERDQECLLFIGREGYFLKQLAEHMRSELRIRPRASYAYLDASRGFLFKLLIDRRDFSDLGLKHHYKGSIEAFLRDRYFLAEDEVSVFGEKLKFANVELPRDKDLLRAIIDARSHLLSPRLEVKRERYLKYIEELTGGAPLVFVDVGFSGTIQKCIGALTRKDTEGYYFFLSEGFGKDTPPGAHRAEGLWVQDARFGAGDPLIDFSLVLETLLTAPWGTLRDIRTVGPDLFVYDQRVPLLKNFFVLEAIIAGVRQHISDFLKAGLTFETWNELMDVRKQFELTLRYDRTDEMSFVRDLFEIDDTISGLGQLKPFAFLPGL